MKTIENHDWVAEFPGAVTVCDDTGILIIMNKKAEDVFKKDGGRALIGKNALDCHPEPSRSLMVELLKSPHVNVYTIEKNCKKKLIYQAPWYKEGKFSGIVELSFELPNEIPHHMREG